MGWTLQTWSLTHPQKKVAEVAIRGMQRPRDLRQSQNDSFSFEQVQDGLGAVSSCAILLPHIDLTSDRWIACTQTRSWADYQRYWWHQCWVSIADLPASSTIHFRTSPFPFMSQTNSCHQHAILLSHICLLLLGILWHPGDFIFLILGLAEEDTISHLSISGVRRFCLQMVTILSTFWHQYRLENSQYQVDFYTVSKIGPC